MQIKNEKPPIWASLKTLLDFDERYTIFTYGDTIYNPAGLPIDSALQAHEEVHSRQQAKMGRVLGPARWWKKYLHDPKWRLAQEVEAYRVQWQHAQRGISDRNLRAAYLREMSGVLAGPTYGNLLTLTEAMRLITQ